MGEKHVVRFEPVGIEIEVDEDQTILRAAAEQGIMLMHGCKEGQCASCKSFVLDGEDIELDRYSTFALPDFEKDEGFTLLCRAHVFEDVTIELLNYDEEMIRSGLPDPGGGDGGRVQRPRHPRHAAPRPQAGRADGDHVLARAVRRHRRCPAPTQTRSFSMANTSSRESGQLEFVIRVYPDGLVLALPGHRADRRRPARRHRSVRCLHPARRPRPDLVFIGGGAGMAPILSPAAVAGRAGHHAARPRTTTGRDASRDLCFEKELRRARGDAAGLPLRPGAVGGRRRRRLGRRGRPDHRHRRSGTRPTSPTPTPTSAARRRWSRRPWMLLTGLGVPEKRIYYDKFTTTGSS